MWYWRDFGFRFLAVVPITACTVWFWSVVNDNADLIDVKSHSGGPSWLHDPWFEAALLGLLTGMCAWSLQADEMSLGTFLVLAVLIFVAMLAAAATGITMQQHGRSITWLMVSFGGIIVSFAVLCSIIGVELVD